MVRKGPRKAQDSAMPMLMSMSRAPALAAACILAGCGFGAGRTAETVNAEPRDVPAVEALPARVGTLPLFEDLSGMVRARNQVVIHPEISASVEEVLVRNGDSVTRGQVLVRLENSRQLEQLRQAEAGLTMAEATAAEARARESEVKAQAVRMRALGSRGLVSDLELETREAQLAAATAQATQAEARVVQARATVAERQAELDRTMVRAPVAGRVGQRAVEVGMVVNTSTTLFLLGDFDDLVVEVPLTQDLLRHVHEGTPVEIDARDHEGNAVSAAVSRISPFLEQSSFSTIAEIDLERGSGLRPGMFVAVRVLRGETAPSTLVPTSAIWEDPRSGTSQIFVIEDAGGLREAVSATDEVPDQAHRVGARTVRVLAEGRGQSGVEGIIGGEWVVTIGQHLLYEQMQATASNTATARVRPTSWAHVIQLQGLQREDLLEGFLSKQRRIAEVIGAELPPSPDVVDELLSSQPTDDATDSDSSPTSPPNEGR
jgi:HlyD family secretion protein